MKKKHVSRPKLVLTDGHISMLAKHSAKYVNANTNGREKVVRQAANAIKRSWQEDTQFDRAAVTSVCDLSAKLGHSQKYF